MEYHTRVCVNVPFCIGIATDEHPFDISAEDMRQMVLENLHDQMQYMTVEDLKTLVDEHVIVETTEA